MKKKMFWVLVACALLTACGNEENASASLPLEDEQERIVEETDETTNQTDIESTENNSSIIYAKDFLVDGNELKLYIAEENGKVTMNAIGNAETDEKASLMLVALKSTFDDLEDGSYTILINSGELYVMYLTTDNGFLVTGVNKDGSGTMSMPDWIVSEFTMPEQEVNDYVNEILSALSEFGESLNDKF